MTTDSDLPSELVPADGPEAGTPAGAVDAPGRGVLSPVERLSEFLYGIILVLTFTGTLRVAVQKGQELNLALKATVGCCLAWAIVDGAVYVFNRVASRNRSLKLLRELQDDPGSARQRIVAAVPAVVALSIAPAEWDKVAETIRDLRLPERAESTNEDLVGALGIFVLANAALLPLAAPFVLMRDLHQAQHASNGLALLLLFAGGFRLAYETGERPLRVGFRFLAFGAFLVAVTMALGG